MMIFEHVALNVAAPAAMADWYCTHFGLSVLHGADAPVPVRFIGNPENGMVVLELYANPSVPVEDFAQMSQVTFHLAFLTDNVQREYERILQCGATPLVEVETLANGNEVAFFRDPWGVPVQFIKRMQNLTPRYVPQNIMHTSMTGV